MKQLRTAVMYAVAALVSCTVRICQLLFMTDPETGFFYPRFQTLGTILTVLYVAIFAASVVVSFSEMRGTVKLPTGSIPRTVVLFFAAVAVFLELPGTIGSASNPIIKVLLGATVIGSALFFAAEGAKGLHFAEFPAEVRKWLALCPTCFWLIKTVMAFTHYMTIANISENVFDLVATGFLSFFFLVYGKVINGIETKMSARMVVPLGLCTSLVCLICSLPRYAARIFAVGVLHESTPPDILYPVLAVAVLFLLPKRVDGRR